MATEMFANIFNVFFNYFTCSSFLGEVIEFIFQFSFVLSFQHLLLVGDKLGYGRIGYLLVGAAGRKAADRDLNMWTSGVFLTLRVGMYPLFNAVRVSRYVDR